MEADTVLTELQAEMLNLLEEAERELTSIKQAVAHSERLRSDEAREAPPEPSKPHAAPKARPSLGRRLAKLG